MSGHGDSLARPGANDPAALEALFAELRFASPGKAAALWRGLGGGEAALAHPGRAALLLDELASSADPDLAIVNLARFVEASIAPGAFFGSFVLEGPICRLAATIFSCSSYLSELLALNPGYLAWLVEEPTLSRGKASSEYRAELGAHAAVFHDARRRLNAVKRYHRRETLRIGARDLLGLAAVEEVTAELSFLADAVIEAAVSLAFAELAPREGLAPEGAAGGELPFHRFAVISLGKLGGTELNYSSDVDLLFVSGDPDSPRESAFYAALARRVVEILSQPTEEGALYRVDLRLRPDGESGPLVVSLEEHLAYLMRRARPWERQALIKARYAAGDRSVADRFIDNCARMVFAHPFAGDPLEEILTMRERAVAGLAPAERAANVKLMPGGIRDIEFIVQAMQLVHGRSRPEVRSRNTLEALERLAHYGILGGEVKETLSRGYRLLRTVEHRLQMSRNVRTHTLPSAEDDLRRVAGRVARSALREVTADNFRGELGRAVLETQHIFREFFRDRAPGTVPLILSLPPGDAAVEELLGRFGVIEGERAHRALSSLVFGDFPNLEGTDTFAAAAAALPSVLARVSATPDPSLTIRNLVLLVKAGGAVKSTLEILAENGDFARLMLSIAAHSTVLSEVLARRMDLLDRLPEGLSPIDPPADAPGDARFIERLGRWYEETLLVAHVANPIPAAGPERAGPPLSEATGRAVEALFEHHGGARLPLALFAAGSVASRRARFGSDLDLVAVTASEDGAASEADVIRSIVADARGIRLGAVDLRLRGEGAGAPLAQTPAYYRRYLETRAGTWELLAFSKCRFLCGSRETGAAFEETLRDAIPRLFGRDGWRERVTDERARLESLSKSPWDVKHAAGGLYDIDFILSAAYLRGLADAPGAPDPLGTLEYLRAVGLLAGGDPETLAAAHRLFWIIEHAAALHAVPYPPLPGREEFFERYLGRLFARELPGEGTFLERLGEVRREVRNIFKRYFEALK